MSTIKRRIEAVAESLASGPARLTDEGLLRYLQTVRAAVSTDEQYGRNSTLNSIYVAAALLALEMRHIDVPLNLVE